MWELILYLYAIPVPFKHTLIRFIIVPLTALFDQQSCVY
jgi:hypothetical protein